jgi:hypothetical protein
LPQLGQTGWGFSFGAFPCVVSFGRAGATRQNQPLLSLGFSFYLLAIQNVRKRSLTTPNQKPNHTQSAIFYLFPYEVRADHNKK